MYGGGGVACVCLSLATVYLLLFVWFVVFDVVFFSFCFLHCLFFPSSAALKFEGKGGRKRKTRWMKKMTTKKKGKKTNQGDKGGITRKTWNTKIKKHNKEEKQNRKEKQQTFCCSCRFGLLASLWAKPCQDKGPKKHYETRFFFCFFFFLFICWGVFGQTNDKNNNKNKTTKTRQQNYKTTKKQYMNKNKTTTITAKQQQ